MTPPKFEVLPPPGLQPTTPEPDVQTALVVRQKLIDGAVAAASDFGMVEMTREKMKAIEDLGIYLTGPSALAASAGRVFMDAAGARKMLQDLVDVSQSSEVAEIRVAAAAAAAPLLRSISATEQIISNVVVALRETSDSTKKIHNKSFQPGMAVQIINNPPAAPIEAKK